MLSQTQAIVLKKTQYTGSSVILKAYTKTFGTRSFMVRGVGGKAKKSALIQPLARIELSANIRYSSQIHTVSSINLIDASFTHFNPVKSSISLFIAEVLTKVLVEEVEDEKLFEFLDASLDFFQRSDNFVNFHIIFLFRLATFMGFSPQGMWTDNRPYFDLESGEFVASQNQNFKALDRARAKRVDQLLRTQAYDYDLQFSNMERRETLEDALSYYQYHIEGFGKMKSTEVLKEMFS